MTDQPGDKAAQSDRVPEPRISVIGVGGAGGNAINNMIRADLEGVEFVVANTDAQALGQSLCETQLQLGASVTKGLGAGAEPEIGQAAAEEAIEEIVGALKGSNMAFITAGMGGGTGTGGAPVIARAARDEGVLTVGVVTKPFHFEGAHRMRQAEAGIAELSRYVDTLIVIPNQNLFLVADEKTTFADAFKMADEVLHSGVRGVTDLMVLPGLINLDFADIRSIMAGMGNAVMGTGEAEGDNRALEAAEAAISNPLLDEVSMKGARSVLINITGGMDLMLVEVDEAANRVRAEVDPDANIIFGSAFSETLEGKIRVSVIATGDDIEQTHQSTSPSARAFVGQSTETPDRKAAVQAAAAVSPEPATSSDESVPESNRGEAKSLESRTAEEPLTLRLVSNLQENQPESENTSPDLRSPEQELTAPDQDPADSTVPQSGATLSTDPTHTPEGAVPATEELTALEAASGSSLAPAQSSEEPSSEEGLTLHLQGSLPVTLDLDKTTSSAEGQSNLANPSEPADDPLPKETGAERLKPGSRRRPLPTPKWSQKPKFQRPAKPVKSESTLETFENTRLRQEKTAPAPEKMHFLVWEIEWGARIYKVPEGKLTSVQNQPHADRLKLFDNLDNAKAEVNAIFKRVAAERTAKGLPKSILEPTLDDILRWEEETVPSYFL
jgi:cell division protein FtsZ